MKKKSIKKIGIGIGLLAAFVLWTVLVRMVDVQAIGPQGSSVGFATWNGFVHALTGIHMSLYVLTDWLGLVPFGVAFGFGVLGLAQWIRRKSLTRVDRSLLLLGGFYVVVMAVYLLFETVVINTRPVLIEGRLEASYPSSTTVLVLCVIPTAIMQIRERIKNRMAWRCVGIVMSVFLVFMVAGRLLSGVHWLTDIIGGVLLSAGLVAIYSGLCTASEGLLKNNVTAHAKGLDKRHGV